ncbi:MAG TPA: hypothetical protein VGS16_13145 [Candidatus Dormibacteraeota bacterium]|nr:hypothetical protein [Candidatus Dormibacteraeota bacterium]
MPDLTHLWQRFLLASALVVGLLLGAAATVFGYSNLTTVNVRWSVFHIDGIPLWTVAVVPLAIVLVAGTIYHWMDGLHHFTEHMRHRHRVHELEAEVASLRAHLDQVLEMPDQSTSRLPRKSVTVEPLPPVEEIPAPALPQPAVVAEPAAVSEPAPAPALANGQSRGGHPRARRAKRAALTVAKPAEPVAATTNGGHKTGTTEPAPET